MHTSLKNMSWSSVFRMKGCGLRNSWKRAIVAGLTAVAMTVGADAALTTWVANGVDWGTNYYNPDEIENPLLYDKLPNAATGTNPKWTRGGAGGTAELHGSFLELITVQSETTGMGNEVVFRQTQNASAALTGTITVETRMRIEDFSGTATIAAALLIPASSTQYFNIPFRLNSVGSGTNGIAPVNLAEWTTLRFTITGGLTTSPVLTIYVNDNPVGFTSTSVTNSALGYIQFGDGTTSGSQDGITQWDYIRWTTSGAYAPIPEPHSLALLGTGVLVFAIRRRLRRGSVPVARP
jgi:hypothetical protein